MSEAKAKYFIVDFTSKEIFDYNTKREAEDHLEDMLDSDPATIMNEINDGILIVIKGKQVEMESFKVKLEE